jgi:hypothetical protein
MCLHTYAHKHTHTHTNMHSHKHLHTKHTHTHIPSIYDSIIPISLYIKNIQMLIVTKLAKYFPRMCSQNALGTCTIKT